MRVEDADPSEVQLFCGLPNLEVVCGVAQNLNPGRTKLRLSTVMKRRKKRTYLYTAPIIPFFSSSAFLALSFCNVVHQSTCVQRSFFMSVFALCNFTSHTSLNSGWVLDGIRH